MSVKYLVLVILIVDIQIIAIGQKPPIFGVYQFNDDTYAAFGMIEDKPIVIFSDGRVRGIRYGSSKKIVEIGNALGLFNGIEGHVLKSDNTIELIEHGTAKKVGVQMKFNMQNVSFTNGDVRLSGTLILPPGKGPFPCVLFTHGSGSEHKEASYGLAFLFAGNGTAAFVYDKRFVDDKDENKWQDSFVNYAGDAVAAAEMLQLRKDIIPDKVGIYGHSQGGWVAPLAASMSDRFSFVIISAGNVVTPVEQHLYSGSCVLRQGGVKERAIQEIYEFRLIKYEAGITGNHEKYEKALPIAQQKPWFERTGGELPKSRFWLLNGYYDSKPALLRLKVPVLVIAGELDKYTDTQRNINLFQEIFKESGNPDVTYKIFPSANHAFLETSTGNLDETEMTQLKSFAHGYFALLTTWIKEKTQ